ncbi:hypothetical protein [Wenyingzhuangia aestuarii]|nr:hypothetical protein [Wenyingzhuangia aestuarii]NJB81251.1 hypothetical protein [Wenyingzhuangia aestuarii]
MSEENIPESFQYPFILEDNNGIPKTIKSDQDLRQFLKENNSN